MWGVTRDNTTSTYCTLCPYSKYLVRSNNKYNYSKEVLWVLHHCSMAQWCILKRSILCRRLTAEIVKKGWGRILFLGNFKHIILLKWLCEGGRSPRLDDAIKVHNWNHTLYQVFIKPLFSCYVYSTCEWMFVLHF